MFKDEQHLWNILFSALLVCVVAPAYAWLIVSSKIPEDIPMFDVLLIIFASFRITRLFIFDVITQWVRDLFLDVQIMATGDLVRTKPTRGPRRTLATLFACPWCLGLWVAFVVCFLYFATPYAWVFIFAFAVAGFTSLLQIFSNLIGWHAELQKQQSESFQK